jgi:NAD(P)-dependent dehydrogenase (short-subunit alcohol dehydrogenase family)
MDTPGTAPLRSASYRQWLEQHIAMGRLGGPEDVAGAAVYLASDDAARTTGAAIEVDGGVGAI